MGERLLGHARRILQLDEEAQSLLRDPAGTAAISIGMPEDLATLAMAQGLARFAARNSRIRLDVVTGLSRDLAGRYRQGNSTSSSSRKTSPPRIAAPASRSRWAGLPVPATRWRRAILCPW